MKTIILPLVFSASVLADSADTPLALRDDIPARAYLEHNSLYNAESVIPPQCYTKTEGKNNPCFVCHQTNVDGRPNTMNDGSLQGSYDFSDLGLNNHWQNLFKDRRDAIKATSDADIDAYVRQDNYQALLSRANSEQWPAEPLQLEQLAYPNQAFDELGFAKDGSHWVAFNYKPFPSTFWPTNGSTGDVMIRLPKAFREHQGHYSRDLYLANLSLLEMTIKDLDSLSVPSLSETKLKLDLNGNGQLEPQITQIQRQSHYLGDASNQPLNRMLYPKDTEFLHSVRYIDIDAHGNIQPAPRMKELRYMRKHIDVTPQQLRSAYYLERKEKLFENLPQTTFIGDKGIANNFGWTINGYIEDDAGELRHQNQQELAFCNGCHKTIGTTIDQVFSFARKVEGAQGWGYLDLSVQQDVPSFSDNQTLSKTQGEFLTYMQRVGGGDEFRQNTEMLSRWFDAEGNVDVAKVESVSSIAELILPSPQRARALNKAYREIVKEQSYLFGRYAVLAPAANVFQQINVDVPPLEPQHRYRFDIRLEWFAKSMQKSQLATTNQQTAVE